MIAMLRGRLLHSDGSRGILDVAGVGYEIFAPTRALQAWAGESEVVVHVSTQVREDSFQLYGFDSDVERRAFVVLLGISGFGPKLALQTLDALPVERLTRAVESSDTATLGLIPGVGKHKAQRLALELKGKLPAEFLVAAKSGRTISTRVTTDPLSLALAQLEYGRSEIERALQALAADGVPPDAQPEIRLKAALRFLAGSAS
jgi:Holliday junction DNA helicase RuvA